MSENEKGLKTLRSERDRVLALAGVFQAARLTQQVARNGMADSAAMESSIGSLFKIDADSVEEVFEGVPGVSLGLQVLQEQLEGQRPRDAELTRYVVALLQLERRLAKTPPLLQQIGAAIATATQRLEHFPPLHANILAQLADLYQDTISPLKPRIMVRGEPLHLRNPENVNKIRSLLLAGIRCARMWRQVGGRKTQVLFARRRIAGVARQLLAGP